MSFEFDFSNVETSGFEPVPDNSWYIATVIEASEIKKSQQKGTPYFELKFQLKSALNPDHSRFEGRNVKMSVYITEKSMSIVKSHLLSLGFDESELRPFVYDPNMFLGRTARVKVIQESSDEGAVYNKIKSLLPLTVTQARTLLD